MKIYIGILWFTRANNGLFTILQNWLKISLMSSPVRSPWMETFTEFDCRLVGVNAWERAGLWYMHSFFFLELELKRWCWNTWRFYKWEWWWSWTGIVFWKSTWRLSTCPQRYTPRFAGGERCRKLLIWWWGANCIFPQRNGASLWLCFHLFLNYVAALLPAQHH